MNSGFHLRMKEEIVYSIYLYSDGSFTRNSSQYGYWVGKSYDHTDCTYPVCENTIYQRKQYKSLKRAITSGNIAIDKYGYVYGFDVEDEQGNVVYKSYDQVAEKKNSFAWNDTIHNLCEMELNKEDEMENKLITNKTRTWNFSMSDKGYIRFNDSNGLGCTTDCGAVLAFANSIFREVKGKLVKVHIIIEEI